jgi:ABC-2 type transport system ATP-binding protein
MRRRLGVARALINSPRILFLDEPTLGIDPVGHRELLQVIRKTAEVEQVAVLLSSHLLGEVEQMCSKVLILKRGHVVAEGTVSEIKRRVSATRTCRVLVAEENVEQALAALSTMPGVEGRPSPDRQNEIVVSSAGSDEADAMGEILQHLLQARVPIESYSRDSMSFSDAFLSMIEEAKPE